MHLDLESCVAGTRRELGQIQERINFRDRKLIVHAGDLTLEICE